MNRRFWSKLPLLFPARQHKPKPPCQHIISVSPAFQQADRRIWRFAFSGFLSDILIQPIDNIIDCDKMISNLAMLFASLAFGKHTTSQGMSIRQICASAFGNGIQGGSGVSDVINSYSIFLFLPSFCVLFWGCFGQKHSGQSPFFHAALSPCQCRQGRVMPLPAYCVIHILVQSSRFFLMPFLPPVSPAAFCSLWCARCGRDFHSFHSSWHHFVWGAYPISPVIAIK